MSVVEYSANDRFVFVTEKRIDIQPDLTWQNTYEFNAVVDGDMTDLTTLAIVLANFEAALLRTNATVVNVRVSTWAADSHPYDPTAFLNVPAMIGGTSVMFGENLPLQECLQVYRNGSYGRLGLLDLRGVLNLDDVNAGFTSFELNNPAGAQTSVTDAVTDSGLAAYIGTTPSTLQMGMIDKNGAFRPVFTLVVNGVRHIKLKHKWFDRS